MSKQILLARQLEDYPFHLEYRTRWSDNDMYNHLNNSIYYFLYDSIVNTYLIQHCSLNPSNSVQIGLVAHSSSDYFGPVSFPNVLNLGLRVSKLGKSSATYEIGVFERGVDKVKAVGSLVHVFVLKATNRPSLDGMPVTIRLGLEKLLSKDKAKL